MPVARSNVVRLLSGDPVDCDPTAGFRNDARSNLQALRIALDTLQRAKRQLGAATTEFDRATAAETGHDPQLRSCALFQQISALEAGIRRLVGAMTTHQPQA